MRLTDFLSCPPNRPFCVLIGHPVSHSLSPRLHGEAFRLTDLDWDYHAVDVEPADLQRVADLFASERFRGANVTIPHKVAIVPFLDVLRPPADSIGAVNTIVPGGDGLVGHNTDLPGFLDPLLAHLDHLRGKAAVVFGSGGARLAVVHALRSIGMAPVVTVSRYPDPADASAMGYDAFGTSTLDPTLWVNTTPLGMEAYPDASPIAGFRLAYNPDRIGYDLIYRREPTPFLKAIRQAGGTVLNGEPMFIGQARRSFELWTGAPMPVEAERVLV